jgi:hypothetical protein
LDSTKNSTAINTKNTTAAEAKFANVLVGGGNRLSVNNSGGGVSIMNLTFKAKEKSNFTVEKAANLVLGTINAKDADVTFQLPQGFKKNDTFVSAIGTVDLTGSTIMIDDKMAALNPGDAFTLVGVANKDDLKFNSQTVVAKIGNSLEHVYTLDKDATGIKTTYSKFQAAPQTKAYSEGMAAQMAFLTTGSDLLSDSGTSHAALASKGMEGPQAFSALSYANSRYETGSHVDVDSFNLIIGASYGFVADLTDVTLGAFFEYGNGGYDSENTFASYTVKGDGDVDYAGWGVLSRFDFAKSDRGSTYGEFSARFGKSSNDFYSADFLIPVKYNLKSNYFGLNFAVGRIFHVSENTSLDLYAKYLWSHQSGASVKLPENQVINFSDVDSHRIRGGVRLSVHATDKVKPYFGAAYEYEADGKAKATILGAKIDAPSLKGSTGIGEAGLSIYTDSPVNFDFGIQGYVGQRKGISGSVTLNFEF